MDQLWVLTELEATFGDRRLGSGGVLAARPRGPDLAQPPGRRGGVAADPPRRARGRTRRRRSRRPQ